MAIRLRTHSLEIDSTWNVRFTVDDPTTIYMVTIGIELFSGFIRSLFFGFLVSPFILLIFSSIAILLGVYPTDIFSMGLSVSMLVGILLGFLNVILSFLAFNGYVSGQNFTRFLLGARQLSKRETENIQSVFVQILEQTDKQITGFSKIYAIDSPIEFLYLIGTTLYISSGAINSRHLAPIIAHELGHHQNRDGGLILALRHLVFPLFYMLIGSVRNFSTNRTISSSGNDFKPSDIYFSMVNNLIFLLFSLAGGGFGVWLTSWIWSGYFRRRDYLADAFVASVGLKDDLIAYLEETKFYDTSVPYMLGWRPANELRIDKLID